MSTDDKSKDWYNKNADSYTKHVRDKDDSIYHSLYEKPAIYSLLPDLNNKTVISLGCGSGEDCSYLSSKGAKRVVGIDTSERLINIARKSYPNCEFEVMDMEHLDFSDESFNFAYSSLAIHYIEDWHKAFQEVYRILKPNSYFLFSCNHPVATALEIISDDGNIRISELSRIRNRAKDVVTIKGDYLSRKRLEGDPRKFDVTTWHKSIGEIAQEATDAGFLISNIKEPKPKNKMKDISNTDYQTLSKIPFFIIFKLLKP